MNRNKKVVTELEPVTTEEKKTPSKIHLNDSSTSPIIQQFSFDQMRLKAKAVILFDGLQNFYVEQSLDEQHEPTACYLFGLSVWCAALSGILNDQITPILHPIAAQNEMFLNDGGILEADYRQLYKLYADGRYDW